MKSWKLIIASILALVVLLVAPLAAMAQDTDESTDTAVAKARIKGGLEIVAPRVALVGKEFTMAVFLRYNQQPMEDAAVWAVTKDDVEALRGDFKSLKANGLAKVTEEDYTNLLNTYAVLIGHTDENGKLSYTYNEVGNHALVAVKAGYIPDISGIAVRQVLAITSPQKAAPGEEFTVTVNQRGTGSPVEKASIWAVARADIPAIKDRIQEFKKNNPGEFWNNDWKQFLDNQAISLGQTAADGELTCSLENAGGYGLVALKQGSLPGFKGIAIIVPEPGATDTTDDIFE